MLGAEKCEIMQNLLLWVGAGLEEVTGAGRRLCSLHA